MRVILMFLLALLLFPRVGRAQFTVKELVGGMLKAADTNNMLPSDEAKLLKHEQSLIADYERAQSLEADQRLRAALAYAYCSNIDMAFNTLQAVIDKNTTNSLAYCYLGLLYLGQNKFNEAVKPLRKSWDLGDYRALKSLGWAYLYTTNREELGAIVPALLDGHEGHPGVSGLLAFYSKMSTPHDTNLFLKAIDGLTDDQMLEEDVNSFTGNFICGLWEVGQEARARRLVMRVQATNSEGADLLGCIPPNLIIANYENDPSAWKQDELILAAIAYGRIGGRGQLEKAKPLYQSYIQSRPRDGRARRGLGFILYGTDKDTVGAITQFKKGWEVGDVASLKSLCGVYLMEDRRDDFRKLIPDALKHKTEDIELLVLLVQFAGLTSNHDFYSKAMEGITDQMILEHKDAPESLERLAKVMEYFDDNTRAKKILQTAP